MQEELKKRCPRAIDICPICGGGDVYAKGNKYFNCCLCNVTFRATNITQSKATATEFTIVKERNINITATQQ